MALRDELIKLSKKIEDKRDSFLTEEATKMGLIVPFIHALGYNVFDPNEVCPEYVSTPSDKKDQRVDYAILKDNHPIILIECKALGTPLEKGQADQLRKYFGGGDFKAPVAILTDGCVYKFYTDLVTPNKMDKSPYMTFDLSKIKDRLIPEIAKLSKENFDPEDAVSSAERLKYTENFKTTFAANIERPDDKLVQFFIEQSDFEGSKITAKIKEKFRPILRDAISGYILDQINDRFSQALANAKKEEENKAKQSEAEAAAAIAEDNTAPNEEEIQGLYIVKSIVSPEIAPSAVQGKSQKSKFSVLLNGNIQRPIVRFYFDNSDDLEIGIVNENKDVERVKIDSVEDIYKYADPIKRRALLYVKPAPATAEEKTE